MRAAHITSHGELDQLTIGDVSDPKPASDEVVVEVAAAALNHLDIWVRKGRPGLTLTFPHVLGSDATGTVAETGAGVDSSLKGRRVVLNPGLWCGHCEWCLRGDHSECSTYSIVGLGRWGTFSQRVAVPAVCVSPAPEHLNAHEAAALPLAYLTAWRMLTTRGQLEAGETLLIHGIGGGVAIAGLQLAKLKGARVIVSSSKEQKLKRAGELGADDFIDYSKTQDVAAEVKRITNGRGVDLVLDTTGAGTWPINFASVRKGGRIVHCGVTAGKIAEVDIGALYWNHITVMGSTMGSQGEFQGLVAAVGAAKMKPVIDKIFPLAEARAAQERMETGEQFGKIVLEVSGK
ncbi:MAG: zinc-binding dehydrogenase [Candidatus Hydrogenedentes bacterium]|nr:zinc-binding dehydrogenase [Candidatus Hydrogenedentota bacterium]